MIDLTRLDERKNLVDEIRGEENERRKANAYRCFEVYRQRMSTFLNDRLLAEFKSKTVRNMRKISSINLSKRIIDEQASIYTTPPGREFMEVSDNELEQIEKLYSMGKVDNRLKLSNRYYKLFHQSILQVYPKHGKLYLRPLTPHQVDAIPSSDDPEIADGYVISGFDKFENTPNRGIEGAGAAGQTFNRPYQDDRNQKIADQDDYKAELARFEVWTRDFNFIMNGHGDIVSETDENPIQGTLPFIDISDEKDFEFWVRKGNSTVEFTLDFAVAMSDLANILKLQGYSVPVVKALKFPQDAVIGPEHAIFFEIDPNRPEVQQSLEFVSPNADIGNSIQYIETLINLFLSAEGLDVSTITGTGNSKSYSSGIERLLAMLEKFEASRDDFSLFESVEQQLFKLMVTWSNALQGTDGLMPELQGATINENAELITNFKKPEMIQTKKELEESVQRKIELGIMSRVEGIMELRGVDREQAEEILQTIDRDEIGGGRVDQGIEE